MKQRPILFNGEMVRAILSGQKTQTRRICKPAQAASLSYVVDAPYGQWGDEDGEVLFKSPYGVRGDQLWMRETWQHSNFPLGPYDDDCDIFYRADYLDDPHGPDGEKSPEGKYRFWKPAIHMPRGASRITLEITGVRVERLQDISEEDAKAEGCEMAEETTADDERLKIECGYFPPSSYAHGYRILWEQINGPGSWDANPWVWVVEFKQVK